MNKFFNCIIFLIIFFYYNLIRCDAQTSTLKQTEYDCMVTLLGVFSNGTPDYNSTGYYNFNKTSTMGVKANEIRNFGVYQLFINQTTTTPIDPSIFSCLKSAISVSFYNPHPDSIGSVISSLSLPSTLQTLIIHSNSDQGVTFGKIKSGITTFSLYIGQQPTDLNINFSMINTTTTFTLAPEDPLIINDNNFKVHFYNDLEKNWSPTSFKIDTFTFPSLKWLINSPNLEITLAPGYDRNSLNDNIINSTSIQYLMIVGPDENSPFPYNIENLKTDYLTLIKFDMSFSTSLKMINLSSIGKNLTNIIFQNLGRDFHYNGNFPLILPNKMKSITYTDSFIQNLELNQWIIKYENFTNLNLANNKMNGQLSTISKTSLTTLDLTNNNLTGSIDKTFCTINNLYLTNNSLSGEIPTCFTCFFYSGSLLPDRFRGNNFSNFNTPPPCTTVVPNIIREESDANNWMFYIFGEDLGGSFGGAKILPDSNYPSFSVSLSIKNFNLFSFKVAKTVDVPKILILNYPYNNIGNFSLAWESMNPQIDNVDWVGDNLIFGGSYFGYNTSIIDIEIDGKKCIVSKSTFYQINCSIASSSLPSNSDHVTIVTVGELSTQITLINNQANPIVQCSNDCNYQYGNGYCDTSKGVCSCNLDWQSIDCSIPYRNCPMGLSGDSSIRCSGLGSCNNQTGSCTCDSAYQGSDCSLPFKKCPMDADGVDCFANGQCNNQTGSCLCNSSHQGSDCLLPFKRCPMDADGVNCFSHGQCNNQTGSCICNSNYQSFDCSVPFFECLNDCSNLGQCNNVSGICSCQDINSISPDCSPIECSDPLCGSNGICNKSIGSCECSDDVYSWRGENCTIPLHFLSSIDSSTINGGNVTFYGWFGNIHVNLTVSIGGIACSPIYNVTDDSILCYSPPGNGNQIVIINQNSYEWTSNSILYQYKEISLKCPNNCTSSTNGKCNTSTGYCTCFNNFGGADCSSITNNNNNNNNNNGGDNDQLLSTDNEPPKSVTIIDSVTSSTTINNQKTSYQILIYSLVEVDYYGNEVFSYSLESNWEKPTEINQSIYQFTQSIQNQQCTINYTIEEVKDNNKQYSFAGVDFTVDAGSIKMTVDITNYQYKSNLNTLQLLMKSSVQTIDIENDNNSCNDENTEIDTIGNGNGGDNDNSLNYISIKKDSKVLYGRFIDRLISDGRSTYMSTTIKSKNNESIIVAMNLPHFVRSCKIDPDFSVLLSTNFKSSCSSDDDNDKKSWLIPVAVTVPIVGTTIISSQLNSNDYGCMENLMNQMVSTPIPQNSSNQYTFCEKNDYFYSECKNGSVVTLFVTQSTSNIIEANYIKCFPVITTFVFNTSIGNITDLLSGSYFTTFQILNLHVNSINGIDNIPKVSSNFKSLILFNYQQKTPLNISFSNLVGLDKFEYRINPDYKNYNIGNSDSNKVYFINDLTKSWNPSSQIYFSQNFPNFNFIGSLVWVYLNKGFDSQSLNDNILSINNTVTSLIVYGPNDFSPFPMNLVNLQSTITNSIYFSMSFQKPIQYIDLSNLVSVSTFTFVSVGDQFNINGDIPIIFYPNLRFLIVSGGLFNNFNISLFLSKYLYLETFFVENNFLKGPLGILEPRLSPSIPVIYVSQNNITGSFDESYCNVNTKVLNNNMSGDLPSCITCFLDNDNQAVNKLFLGNNFSNFDNPPPCTTIVPNLVKLPSDQYYQNFLIFGKDLGIFDTQVLFYKDSNSSFYPPTPKKKYSNNQIYFQVPISLLVPDLLVMYFQNYNKLGNFTLAVNPSNPIINTVGWNSNDELFFEGSYFSYNISIIDITVDGFKCLIDRVSFYQINCTLESTSMSDQDQLTIVRVGDLSTQISLLRNKLNTISMCSTDCGFPATNNSYCSTEIGICQCLINPPWGGIGCQTPLQYASSVTPSSTKGGKATFYGWFSDLNNDFDVTIGSESCTIVSISKDIFTCIAPPGNGTKEVTITQNSYTWTSGPDFYEYIVLPLECPNNCTANGICNTTTGLCTCNKYFIGYDCNETIPFQYVSSINSSTTKGGNATFYGWFGNIHVNLTVSIGGIACSPIYNVTDDSILCYSPPGNGNQIVIINQNSYEWTSNSILYQYKEISLKCPNNCTSSTNGKCNTSTGYCTCFNNFGGADCSSITNNNNNNNNNSNGGENGSSNENNFPPNQNHINDTTGSTTINNQKTSYQILIYSLVEVDYYGNEVFSYSLESNWIKINETDSLIHQFTQFIQNKQCIINYTIEEVKDNNKQYSFAGVDFTVSAGSIKISIDITNYQYNSSLNTLQLLMKSSVQTIDIENDNNSCNDENTEIDTIGNGNGGDNDNSLNYISIKKDSKVLYGRFIDRLISDGRSTYMSTTIKSKNNESIIVAMNLPHFVRSCKIDPDFSVLLSTNFKSSCSSDDDDDKKSWLIPVAVVVPVVGCSLIAVTIYFVYKSQFVEKPFNKKLKRLNKNTQT
ncbi:hypothetical protein ACTFIU_001218 [Dictyostelium citrinum]